jgi:hypothetical protein
MPVAIATPGRILLLCLTGLLALWFLEPFTTHAMDSIPSPFTIKINGKPVAKLHEGAEGRIPAKIGKDAAVFTLKNSRLQSGDWIMGRDLMENRSFGPKKVSWYKANEENEKRVQLVTAKKEGEAYQLMFTSMLELLRPVTSYDRYMLKLVTDGPLMVDDDDDVVFVDLIGGKCQRWLCILLLLTVMQIHILK